MLHTCASVCLPVVVTQVGQLGVCYRGRQRPACTVLCVLLGDSDVMSHSLSLSECVCMCVC